MLAEMLGDVANAAWPPIHNARVASLAALIHQFDRTQWLAPDAIGAQQDRQLAIVSRHLAAYVPAYRERLRAAGLDKRALDRTALADLPPLGRRDIQALGDAFFSAELPPSHGPTAMAQTSGSTGEPVRVARTMVNQLLWNAGTVRYHLWHEPDFRVPLCAIRASTVPAQAFPAWGGVTGQLFPTGPFLRINNDLDVARQIERIVEFGPATLIVYPNNLAAILDALEREGIGLPTIGRIRTIGETLQPDLRARAEQQLAPVRDCYSSEEVGYIAIECPTGGLYHVMAETVIVEVVDDAGRPCPEGEIGHVLVTDLHNHASPLIRYAIGDMAEVGPPCPCGRGQPTLRRIVGRTRNMLLTPDGRCAWPLTGFHDFATIAPVIQYQLIQHRIDAIEVRLVVASPLDDEQETALAALIRRSLGYRFALSFAYFPDRIPRGPNGKFEEFVNLVG